MKTAEEWARTRSSYLDPNDLNKSLEAFIKQIQLDAYKQGMTDAAEMDWYAVVGYKWAEKRIRETILTARDNKTTI